MGNSWFINNKMWIQDSFMFYWMTITVPKSFLLFWKYQFSHIFSFYHYCGWGMKILNQNHTQYIHSLLNTDLPFCPLCWKASLKHDDSNLILYSGVHGIHLSLFSFQERFKPKACVSTYLYTWSWPRQFWYNVMRFKNIIDNSLYRPMGKESIVFWPCSLLPSITFIYSKARDSFSVNSERGIYFFYHTNFCTGDFESFVCKWGNEGSNVEQVVLPPMKISPFWPL